MENTKLCPFCNCEIHIEATRCKNCKKWLKDAETKPRNFLDTLLLNWFLGCYGIHRFYTGYYAIGFLQILTLGGCGLWSIIDFVFICLGNYKDANGIPLKNYNKKLGLTLLIVNLLINIVAVLLVLTIVKIILSLPPEGN